VLLLLVIVAATTTLTLGLVLHEETIRPYAQTRAATAGPDLVAISDSNQQGVTTSADLAALRALTHAPTVADHSGPFPVTTAILRVRGITAGAEVEGRDQAAATVDQPKVTAGRWVRPGGVVVERAFAAALGVQPGSSITLNDRPFQVVGTAVTAAFVPFPQTCFDGCDDTRPPLTSSNIGLMWVTRADARSLVTSAAPLSYFLNLRLRDPSHASTFGAAASDSSTAPDLVSWQQFGQQDGNLVDSEQLVMLVGSWLLALLALASVAVLVGGRMADQMRRVGLLKAVGGTPSMVARVLMTENLTLALVAAVVGLSVGWFVAPLMSGPGAGLLGASGSPRLSLPTVCAVVGVALTVAAVASLLPAVRAARTSTVHALADSARQPGRRAWLIWVSARLPVPLMLAVRLAARRLGRIVLSALSIAVTVTGIVAVLLAHASLKVSQTGLSGLVDPRAQRRDQVLLIITVMLVGLAAINTIFIARAMVVDSRRTSALSRALGVTPYNVAAGLAAAQVIPALAGALVGIPGGIGLVDAVKQGTMVYPPSWQLIAVVIGTVVAVAALTAIPARIGARRPPAPVLQSELT
jgi:putative ABC transport system permease protein